MKNIFIKPNKNLGQNFLINKNIIYAIAGSIGKTLDNINIFEIGAGLGAVTEVLLDNNINSLLAVEKDHRCVEELNNKFSIKYKDKFSVINDDILLFDFNQLKDIQNNWVLVSNLPYNISSQILFKIFDHVEIFSSCILMFQKEVADKLIISQNKKQYSRLSILANYLYNISVVTNVSPENFFPSPKVNSTVLKLVPNPDIDINLYKKLSKITKIAFLQRRKLLVNNLNNHFANIKDVLISLNINPMSRAEDINIKQYVQITKLMQDDIVI